MKIVGLSVFIKNEVSQYSICFVDESKKYVLTLNDKSVPEETERLPPIHYRVKPYQDVNDVFDSSKNYINWDYFELKKRFKEIKRKVWIFKGDSLLGKTFLSDKINLFKYETDSASILPDIFKEEIIVVGNKYKFTVEDVIQRIHDKDSVDIIIVDFSQNKRNS